MGLTKPISYLAHGPRNLGRREERGGLGEMLEFLETEEHLREDEGGAAASEWRCSTTVPKDGEDLGEQMAEVGRPPEPPMKIRNRGRSLKSCHRKSRTLQKKACNISHKNGP